MSDPIKISIGAIFQFIFFPMSLYLSGLCGKLVNNSPAGVFVTWSAQDDPVWQNLQTALKYLKKFKLPGFLLYSKYYTPYLCQEADARALRSCGSAHDLFFVFYHTPLEQLLPNCVTLAVDREDVYFEMLNNIAELLAIPSEILCRHQLANGDKRIPITAFFQLSKIIL